MILLTTVLGKARKNFQEFIDGIIFVLTELATFQLTVIALFLRFVPGFFTLSGIMLVALYISHLTEQHPMKEVLLSPFHSSNL